MNDKDKVIAELGYWPEFCDAKIIKLYFQPYLEAGSNLLIVLHYIDMDLNRDMVVSFTFKEISFIEINDFGLENVVDKFEIINQRGQTRLIKPNNSPYLYYLHKMTKKVAIDDLVAFEMREEVVLKRDNILIPQRESLF